MQILPSLGRSLGGVASPLDVSRPTSRRSLLRNASQVTDGCIVVIVVICHLSKSKVDCQNPTLYIILYIVSNDRVSEIENDK